MRTTNTGQEVHYHNRTKRNTLLTAYNTLSLVDKKVEDFRVRKRIVNFFLENNELWIDIDFEKQEKCKPENNKQIPDPKSPTFAFLALEIHHFPLYSHRSFTSLLIMKDHKPDYTQNITLIMCKCLFIINNSPREKLTYHHI